MQKRLSAQWEDVDFLAATFKGADVVYLMEVLGADADTDQNFHVIAAAVEIGKNYKQAVEQSGVKCVVHLSSLGAYTDKGIGLIKMHYDVEQILNELPDDVSIKFMRPAGFYTNMFGFIPTIKTRGAIVSNYGGDEKRPWVSPLDIAAVISEEIEKPFHGREIRYIASDEISPNEIAKILGEAIGKPDLKWLVVSDEQFRQNLTAAGMNPQVADGLTEMQASQRSGLFYEDYNRHKPTLGKVKLKDFAKEFAAVYNQK